MFSRPLRLVLCLAAAVGIPYVWFNPAVSGKVKQKWSEWTSKRSTSPAYDYDFGSRFVGTADSSAAASAETSTPRPKLTGSLPALEEAFRFDISPRWVLKRWTRVSTVRAEQDLEGLRVPLVTGTNLEDIAGSLTYYFDKQQQLRRITFSGHTGDDRRLVSLVTGQFKLRPEPALGGGMYVARWNAQPTSVLRISLAPVIRSQSPHERLEILLEINRPAFGYSLSTASQAMLNRDRVTSRW